MRQGPGPGFAAGAVVVAGYQADLLWRSQHLQPAAALNELPGHAQLGEISGDQDLLRGIAGEIRAECLQNLGAVLEASLATPGQVTQRSFAEPVAGAERVRGAQVGVGEVGEPPRPRHIPGRGCSAHGGVARGATHSAKAATTRVIWVSE